MQTYLKQALGNHTRCPPDMSRSEPRNWMSKAGWIELVRAESQGVVH
jgi:hypothetical protein